MSASAELQKLIYDRLVADTGVHALVADRIYDRAPLEADFPCITFGPSDVVPLDDECIDGREETIQIDCWARDQGRLRPCREIADAVKAALHDYSADMGVNALCFMRVRTVRVFEDGDGITAHGVVSVTATVEET